LIVLSYFEWCLRRYLYLNVPDTLFYLINKRKNGIKEINIKMMKMDKEVYSTAEITVDFGEIREMVTPRDIE
jgi:hypothetical protein